MLPACGEGAESGWKAGRKRAESGRKAGRKQAESGQKAESPLKLAESRAVGLP
jgi:hypothetical protein